MISRRQFDSHQGISNTGGFGLLSIHLYLPVLTIGYRQQERPFMIRVNGPGQAVSRRLHLFQLILRQLFYYFFILFIVTGIDHGGLSTLPAL